MTRFKRRTESGEEYGATFLELFFDLVFVFAITQVSHLLLEHLGWVGAGQAAMALLVVWWAWQYTTWVTNELDLESNIVRVLMLGLMLAGLLMAIAIPEAFTDKALLFAGSYVAIQVGRHSFLTFAAAEAGTVERERSGRILVWFCAAGVLWIAGALTEGETRIVLWLAALAIDYGGPLVLFWLPGHRHLSGGEWVLGTSHFAERFGLFVIIALGESVILTGATTAGLELDTVRVGALSLAFAGTAALWWLYFTSVALHAERTLAQSADRVLLARDAYTYGHVLIIGGITLTAVGNELVIEHPTEELATAQLVTVVAGPVLFLLAEAWLRLRMTGAISRRRLAGMAGCIAVGFLGANGSALMVAALLVAVLGGVIVADGIAAARRAQPAPP